MGRILLIISFILTCAAGESQVSVIADFRPDPEKVQMYLPYLAVRHGGPEGLETWKKQNQLLYQKELWYYTESFYIRKNVVAEGVELSASIIDISRFEQHRLADEEAIVKIPGYTDVLVLLPAKAVIHFPDYINK